MSKTLKTRPRKAPTAVRSISDSIHDLAGTVLFEAGFTNTIMDREELVEILRMLEDCKEEGRPLYPEILVTTQLTECLQPIHPVQLITCGESADRPGRFRRAIKRCAAVAGEPWVIVLEVSAERLRYGVASTNVRADAESLYEAIFEFAGLDEALPLMFLRRHGTRAVMLRTVKEERVISLTLSEELLKAGEDIANFARTVTANTPEATRANSTRVIQRLVEQACREGHGFIACAMNSSEENISICKTAFADGAWLDPAIDLSAQTPDETNTAATLENDSALRARINLARRMVEVDLMTMFSTNGQLLGYNIHIPASKSGGIAGGARTRAFNALKEHPSLKAVFMCSQDGQTTFNELSDGEK